MNFKKQETLSAILSRCAAKDGMSVRAIKNSRAVKGYVESHNYRMPSSEATIWKLIFDYFVEKKRKQYYNLKSTKRNMENFLLLWTSGRTIPLKDT